MQNDEEKSIIDKAAVRVTDVLTGQIYAANWLLERNSHTMPWLGARYTTDSLLIPETCFLAEKIETHWASDPNKLKVSFYEHGYPIQIEIENKSWFCLLKRPINYSLDGSGFINCKAEFADVKPTEYCEAVEAWREEYERYLKERKK